MEKEKKGERKNTQKDQDKTRGIFLVKSSKLTQKKNLKILKKERWKKREGERKKKIKKYKKEKKIFEE